MSATSQALRLPASRLEETRKIAAFVRRDFLIAWSYRTAFVSDWFSMLFQASIFYLVGRMVSPASLPVYAGHHPSYLEFAAIGISLTAFATVGLHRIASAVRQEQLMGTLEALLVTPTMLTTIQLGAVVYDLIYIPIRTALFLLLVDVSVGLHFQAGGILPALLILVVFMPFIWGLGVMAAAAALTYRRGVSIFAFGVTLLAVGSTSYFPLATLPGWLHWAAAHNPMTLAADGIRASLFAGPDWSGALSTLGELAPFGAVALLAGILAFHLALRRERRRGTLALY